MKRARISHLDNGLADALEVVGPWWSLLIVWSVMNGNQKFEPIREELRIARNILSDRLRDLVEAEVLEKRPYCEKPVRYEYVLTDKGRALVPVLSSLEKWGDSWIRSGG